MRKPRRHYYEIDFDSSDYDLIRIIYQNQVGWIPIKASSFVDRLDSKILINIIDHWFRQYSGHFHFNKSLLLQFIDIIERSKVEFLRTSFRNYTINFLSDIDFEKGSVNLKKEKKESAMIIRRLNSQLQSNHGLICLTTFGLMVALYSSCQRLSVSNFIYSNRFDFNCFVKHHVLR